MTKEKGNLIKKLKGFKLPLAARIVLWALVVGLTIALFITVRGFVGCWNLTSLDGIPLPNCSNGSSQGSEAVPVGVTMNAEGTPISTAVAVLPTIGAPQVELPPAWDGASRVTVLFIGLDYRDWEAGTGAPRSDSMILFTVDPVTKVAGLFSIPRDTWVNIPGGFGYGKINMAYMYGESYKLPGGGPELAMQTVENFLGIPVDYYIQIDFNTFVTMIDEIGGIDLIVPKGIKIDPLGAGNTIKLHKGEQHLDGALALAYARARYTANDDIDRSQRQQDVIMAIRAKVLDPLYFTTLVGKAPSLYQQLSSGIHTDMAFEDAMRLGMLAKDIPVESIKRGVIDYTMVVPETVFYKGESLAIVRPIPDKIAVLRDEVFGSGAVSPMATGDPAELMKIEGATVSILNGTFTGGLAQRTTDFFTAAGMNVVNVGNYDYSVRTVIIDHGSNPYLVKYLMTMLNMTSGQLRLDFDPNASVEVEIILGDDWAYNNPMP